MRIPNLPVFLLVVVLICGGIVLPQETSESTDFPSMDALFIWERATGIVNYYIIEATYDQGQTYIDAGRTLNETPEFVFTIADDRTFQVRVRGIGAYTHGPRSDWSEPFTPEIIGKPGKPTITRVEIR